MLFAIPKKGRLYEKIVELLQAIDIKFKRKNRLDVALSTNHNIALVFLPASDIATFVANGRVHLGITGQDIIRESQVEVNEELALGFGNCKLCVQTPTVMKYTSAKQLAGKRIVTSFTNITTEYFKQLDPSQETSVTHVSGSVEAACSLGLADAVVDLVESGDTMRAAGLEAIEDIMSTEAVMISNPHESQHNALISKMKKRMQGMLTAQQYVFLTFNIARSKLPAAAEIAPGRKAPTVMPLEDGEYCAVSVMISKKEVHNKMDQLEDIGATDIMMMDIANCRE